MGRSPAFQLYAADFYTDTAGWTATEVGAYIRILLHQWTEGPFQNKISYLSRVAGVDPRNMKKIWSSIAHKFVTVDQLRSCLPDAANLQYPDDANLLVNIRLEETRIRQEKYRESQRMNAERRWRSGDDYHMPSHCQPICDGNALQSSSLKKNNKPPLSPLNENPPRVAKTSWDGSRFKNIPPELIEKWRIIAPGISIEREIAAAEAWVIANPTKIKSNWNRFLTSWMTRAQDKPKPERGGNGSGSRHGKNFGRTEPELPPETLDIIAKVNRIAAEKRKRLEAEAARASEA